MRPRLLTVAVSIGVVLAIACNRSTPTAPAPSSAPPTSTGLDLASGAYALTLTISRQGSLICNNGTCTSISLCVGVSSAPSVNSLTARVRLDRSGDAIAIRPEELSASFRMDLYVAGKVVTGTASGQLWEGPVQASIGAGQSTARITGTRLPTSVAGSIDGQLTIGGNSCSNNGHGWSLGPR